MGGCDAAVDEITKALARCTLEVVTEVLAMVVEAGSTSEMVVTADDCSVGVVRELVADTLP